MPIQKVVEPKLIAQLDDLCYWYLDFYIDHSSITNKQNAKENNQSAFGGFLTQAQHQVGQDSFEQYKVGFSPHICQIFSTQMHSKVCQHKRMLKFGKRHELTFGVLANGIILEQYLSYVLGVLEGEKN